MENLEPQILWITCRNGNVVFSDTWNTIVTSGCLRRMLGTMFQPVYYLKPISYSNL